MQNNHELERRVKILEAELSAVKRIVADLTRKEISAVISDEEILTVNEAMKLLNLPRHIIYAKTLNGEIPGFRIGKLYKYKKSELITWDLAEKQGNHLNVDDFVERYMLGHTRKA